MNKRIVRKRDLQLFLQLLPTKICQFMKKYAMKAENEYAVRWRIILKNRGITEVYNNDKNTFHLPRQYAAIYHQTLVNTAFARRDALNLDHI